MGDMPDLSSLLGMLNEKGIDLNNIMQNFSNNNTSSNGYTNNSKNNLNQILNINNIDSSSTQNQQSTNTNPGTSNPLYTSNQQSSNTNSGTSNFQFNSTNENSSNQQDSINSNFQMPDMETILRLMKLMNSNSNNPSTNLLYSLKPFLRDSKKEKIDQYVNFLKISSIISELNKSGGDSK